MERPDHAATLFRTTALVAAVNVFSKLLGVAREALVAGSFGAHEATDAFFAAWRLPDVLFNSLLGVLLANTFIPVFFELTASHGPGAARRFARSACGAALLALSLAALCYALFADSVMAVLAPGLSPQAREFGADMARLLAPVAVAGGLTGILRAMLHAEGRFLVPAWLPVVQNLCVIGMILALGPLVGVASMAWALLLSCVLQAAMLYAPLVREGRAPRPSLDFADPGLKRMGALMAPVLATFALGNVIPLLEVHLASDVASGAISHLSYAYRLFTLPEQVFALTLSAVLFPYLARDAGAGDREAMAAKLSAGLRACLYLTAPMGAFLAVFSEETVRLFLGRGAFGPEAVAGTGLVLAAYAGGLFAVCARNLLVDACFALTSPGIILKVAAAMIPVNAALDVWLCGLLGTPGLALGFSLTAALHCLALGLALGPRLHGLDARAVLAALARAAAGSALVAALCLAARPTLAGLSAESGFAGQLALLGLAAALAGALYAGAQSLMRSPEQALLTGALRRRRP